MERFPYFDGRSTTGTDGHQRTREGFLEGNRGALPCQARSAPVSSWQNMEKLTLGSLFSGIGGFELGFERTGKIQTIWQVEIDAYCRRVLAKHWPTVQRFADIRECCGHSAENPRWRYHSEFCDKKYRLPYADILCGGFPCQDISNAGKRAGIGGERSGLWSEYARIIRELRPRYVVVENVAALLGRGMERVLGDLAACGYDAEWQSIRASDVGAPHRRERIWIVAYPQRSGIREQSILGAECGGAAIPQFNRKDVADSSESRFAPWPCGADVAREREGRLSELDGRNSDVSNTNGGRFAVQGESSGRDGLAARGGETFPHDDECADQRTEPQPIFGAVPETIGGSRYREQWSTEPDVGRLAHGVPARVDRLRGLGNAIVPQIAEFIGHRIVADAFPSSRITLPSSGQATHKSRITEVSA